MIRVKDAEASLKWYTEVLGMELVDTLEQPAGGFNLYFLGYKSDLPRHSREGLLELTWNYGTEKQEGFSYHDGNKGPQGFGHICESRPTGRIFCYLGPPITDMWWCEGVSVDNLEAACKRFEDLNCNWKKRLTDGRMKNVAFLLDPDGYWVEVIQNERFTGKPNF